MIVDAVSFSPTCYNNKTSLLLTVEYNWGAETKHRC